MSCVQKYDVMNTKKLHIVTRQGTKIGNDNPSISKIKEKNDYPKQLYNNASDLFKQFARKEAVDDGRQNTVK